MIGLHTHSQFLFILPLNGHPVHYLCFQAKLDGISNECHFRPLKCYAVLYHHFPAISDLVVMTMATLYSIPPLFFLYLEFGNS